MTRTIVSVECSYGCGATWGLTGHSGHDGAQEMMRRRHEDQECPARRPDPMAAALARALVRRHQRTERLCSSGDHDLEAAELVALMREAGWR